MENKYGVKSVSTNFIWRFLERCGAQGVTLVVSIVLARILGPDVYGTVALVTVIITLLEVFISSGIGTALIQKKDADNIDFSTVFYFNIVCGFLLYAVMFSCAPLIAWYYERPELTQLVRVISLTLIISSVKNVQHAYVAKNMIFKKFFFATLIGTIVAAIVGIVSAVLGLGVWAIVLQSLSNNLIDTIVLWVVVKWRPIKAFSWKRLKELYKYGWKLLVSALIEKFYTQLRTLIIGKRYSSSDLAFYNKGNQFPQTITMNINSSIDSVLLPTMAASQNRVDQIRNIARKSIKVSTYLMMPLMVGLAVCAESLVRLLLTEEWLPCVFYLRIFCFTYAFYPIHTANLNAIKALGRSDIFLILEIIKKGVGLVALFSTIFISVEAMAMSLLITSVISQIINTWPNKKLLNYTYFEQIKDIFPQIALSLLMGTIVYSVSLFGWGDLITLSVQVPLGAIVYILGSKIFHMDSFDYLVGIIKSYVRRQKVNDDNKGE